MIRLDKLLARSGFGTRKEVKKLIRRSEVLVNGQIVTKDDIKVSSDDKIIVQGIEIEYQDKIYLMLNKPDGYVCANSDDVNATVMDRLDFVRDDIFCVGRLDKDTHGLCLISNDGALSHQLLSNKKHVEKEYYVKIAHKLSDEDIIALEGGITIDNDEVCKEAKVKVISDQEIYLIITEGKYHQIKRMLKAVDNEVLYLKRIRMKNLILDRDLKEGQYRYLTDEEIEDLKA